MFSMGSSLRNGDKASKHEVESKFSSISVNFDNPFIESLNVGSFELDYAGTANTSNLTCPYLDLQVAS